MLVESNTVRAGIRGPEDDLTRLFADLDEVVGRIQDVALRTELARCRQRFRELDDVLPVPAELTPRARRVVVQVSTGSSNSQVAGDLGMTVDAVKGQLRVAMRAFGVHTRQATVNAARSAGLLL